MVNSRSKGSAYERDVRKRLELELGLKFERVLAQWREAELPDLVCEDDAFPFVIECKRYRTGSTFASPSHWDQCVAAAKKAGSLYYEGKDGKRKAAVTKADLDKSGLSLRDYMNFMTGKTRKPTKKKMSYGGVSLKPKKKMK